MEIIKTNIWAEYEKGVDYNRKKGLYNETDDNYNFYHGNQWNNAELGDMKPITLNIIKPTIKYKLGIINSNAYQIVYSPNNYDKIEFQNEMKELCKDLNKHTSKVWELEQVDKKIKEALKDSAINSEGILYFYNSEEDIKVELIDKTNIYYGNENESNIQEQPYIIISFRLPVEKVKEEAIANGVKEEIVADEMYEEQSGYDAKYEEITPMCLVLLKLYKKNGTVHSVKSTQTVIIQKEIDHKMTLYPVAHMVWEDIKGSSRGLGEVLYLKSNQIEINKTAMRRAIAVKLGAYPKLVADVDNILNPSALEQVGTTIKMKGQTVDDVRKKIGYLNPAMMSPDSKVLQEELIANTRNLAGAGDIATGQVNPEVASGRAILAVQQASQQPINEQVDKFKTFIEDIARIWFDMWRAYQVEGLTIIRTITLPDGTETEQPYTVPYETLQALKANIKVDITPRSPFDKYAQEQSIENLLTAGYITFDEYVDCLDDDSNMPVHLLKEIIKKREEAKKQIMEMKQAIDSHAMGMQNNLKQAENSENMQLINDIKAEGDNYAISRM